MRKQVNDLSKVQLGGAAHGINTYVAAPRVARTNTALKLSSVLSRVSSLHEQTKDREHRIDIEQATENKLHGGSVLAQALPEAVADYEEYKGTLDTMEKAEAYFMERTVPQEEITDPHTRAGYEENRLKALAKFRGQHAAYLTDKRIETRTRDVLNDFVFNFKTGNASTSFSRLDAIADNYGMDRETLNAVSLRAAEIFVAQGKHSAANAILRHKRGAAGSLLSHPSTAIKANRLYSKIKTEDSIAVANQIKGIQDTTERGSPLSEAQQAGLDSLLKRKKITITQRNNFLHKNEEAVKVGVMSVSLAANLSEPGRSFFDPIPGATTEQSEKARSKFTQDFYNDAEVKRAQNAVDPVQYIKRITKFSEQTNSTNPAVKTRMGAGYSSFNPQAVIAEGVVDQQTLSSVAEYMALHRENPNVAAAHTGSAAMREFYDNINMDVTLGGLPGSPSEQLERALKNYANDALNPLEGKSSLRISDEDILDKFSSVTDSEAGVSLWGNTGAAENASQWVPYIRRQVQEASRRTGTQNKDQLLSHVIKQITARSQRIGTYLAPRGTNTYVGKDEHIEAISSAAVRQYIGNNPDDGYEDEDLVLVPVIGQQNLWAVSVKGSNQILEIIPHNQLPIQK